MTSRDPRGLAERAMHSPALAAIYERVWRPTVFYAGTRLTMSAERRIAVMTSLDAPTPTRRRIRGFAAQRLGLRLFGRDEITGVFAEAGLVEIEQRLRGVTQYVNATKPL